MGRRTHFGSHSFAIPQKYEVKIRSRNFIDRIKNNGEEDHQQSRRVVFKIRVRSFEEKKIEILLNNA